VVLGRPSQVEIRDVLPGWCDLAVDPGVFHVGGPCETDTALVPGRLRHAGGDCGLRPGRRRRAPGRPRRRPDELAGRVRGLRVFAGYAGWSPGQLAVEIAEGAWACVPGVRTTC
jgi:putative transcriptional regulator